VAVDVAVITTHIAPAKGYGGIAESTARLAHAWAAAGHAFSLCAGDASLGRPLTAADVGLPPSVPVRLYRTWLLHRWGFGPGALWRIWRACRTARVVYVSGVGTWPTTLAAVLCCLLRRPFVVAPRAGLMAAYIAEIRRGKRRKWLFYRLITLPTLRAARLLHLTSPCEVDSVARLLPDAPGATVANGLDLNQWPRLPPPPPRAGRVFCYIGRFSAEKGIARFLEVWLSRRHADDRFILAGSGHTDYVRELETVAARGGSAVTLHGYLDPDGVRAVLADSDFLVLPSGIHHEGPRENFGNAVAEALAAGRPVLTTRGLAWDDIEDAGVGFLFDADDGSIRDAIARAGAITPEQASAMADAARRYAETRFDINVTAAKLWALITGAAPEIGPVETRPAETYTVKTYTAET
jgi:glycosyltransferase involved in cell wall biosynthesis